MSLARRDGVGMSIEAFRAFQRQRPDGERWELIEGWPVMMAPPNLMHQKIVSNLLQLLADSLRSGGKDLVAIPAPGVELGLAADVFLAVGKGAAYAPEPDVAVVHDTEDPDERFAQAVVLFAEVVSSTDRLAGVDGRAWIDVKAALYRAHRECAAVLVVEQEQVGIHLWQRNADGWTETALADFDDELAIESCRLRCRVADVYARAHLVRRARDGA